MTKAVIEKIVKIPAEIQAADALRNAIIEGTIAAGARITEGELSEQMCLSRATIRSALTALAGEGLITLKRYAGWSVIKLSSQDIRELYTMRSALERLAAQLVTERNDDEAAAAITAALDALEREVAAGSWVQIADADFGFHKAIVALSGNSRLIGQYAQLEAQIRMYIRAFDGIPIPPEAIMAPHKAIAQAILQGDKLRAGQLSEEHNLTDGEMLERHILTLAKAR